MTGRTGLGRQILIPVAPGEAVDNTALSRDEHDSEVVHDMFIVFPIPETQHPREALDVSLTTGQKMPVRAGQVPRLAVVPPGGRIITRVISDNDDLGGNTAVIQCLLDFIQALQGHRTDPTAGRVGHRKHNRMATQQGEVELPSTILAPFLRQRAQDIRGRPGTYWKEHSPQHHQNSNPEFRRRRYTC